jgi:hypothetical protein
MEPTAEAPPGQDGRVVGLVWLVYFVTAILGAYLVKGLVVPADAAATARNIMAHETLYRSGFAVGLIANAVYIALTALLYRLFEPVNRSISLLAAFLSLVGCATQIIGGLFQLAPLVVLGGSRFLGAFDAEQLQAVALLSLKLYSQVFNISLVLFGLFELTIGYLIIRSTFLPRILGVSMVIAGVAWLTFLWPPLATPLLPYIVALNVGEFLLMLWLLVKGVDVSRWREIASARRTGTL